MIPHSRIRVLSYNIHKGFNLGNQRFVLGALKASIQAVQADIVLLQEVVGHHDRHTKHGLDWPTTAQFEYLADSVWPHFAYGKNAVYSQGHHGNAILSRFPILSWENQDVSYSSIERRGLLKAEIEVPGWKRPLHVFSIHLGLREKDRIRQARRLCHEIARVGPAEPLIVGGDSNDWREKITGLLEGESALQEVFLIKNGEHASTFPAFFPVLKLDRIYVRNLEVHAVHVHSGNRWKKLSDHLPLSADFAPAEY